MNNSIRIFVCSILFLFTVFVAKAQTAADSALVTFRVDMSNVDASFTVPEVNGTFNNWCGNCWAMSDDNGDNIWEVSGNIAINQDHEYKFSADSWGIQESLFPSDDCVVTNFDYTNRSLNVSSDTVLDVVCWESCSDCDAAPSFYNVSFQLDMNGVSGFTTPEINGTFNNWCGNCWAMSDDNGDNIWELSSQLAPGVYEYKYSADNWSIQEELDANLSCVDTTVEESGNILVNRVFEIVDADVALELVAWNQCPQEIIDVLGCTDASATNYNAQATSDDGSCEYPSSALTITTCADQGVSSVRLTGPWWNWDPNGGPEAVDNGDGTWMFTIDPAPTADMEYLLIADGIQEDLVASNSMSGDWSCTPVSDYWSFANRLWVVGSGDVSNNFNSSGTCADSVSVHGGTSFDNRDIYFRFDGVQEDLTAAVLMHQRSTSIHQRLLMMVVVSMLRLP